MTDPDRQNGKTLSSLSRRGGPALGLAIVAPLLGGALLVWQAWTLADVLGRAIESRAPLDTLASGIILLLALLLSRAALGAIGDRAGTAASEFIKAHVRATLFSHLLARSPRSGAQPQSGAASAAIIDQVEALDVSAFRATISKRNAGCFRAGKRRGWPWR